MKVILFKDIYCAEGSFKKYDTAELSTVIAKGLIDGGHAEAVKNAAEKLSEAKQDEPAQAPVKKTTRKKAGEGHAV